MVHVAQRCGRFGGMTGCDISCVALKEPSWVVTRRRVQGRRWQH
jgi:hypothetical protein